MKLTLVVLFALLALASALPRFSRQVFEKTVITRGGPGFGGRGPMYGPGAMQGGFGRGPMGPGFGRGPMGPGFGRGPMGPSTIVKTTIIRPGK